MPYLFPYEQVFVAGVGGLIVLLLLVRFKLTRARRRDSAALARPADPDHAAQSDRADQAER